MAWGITVGLERKNKQQMQKKKIYIILLMKKMYVQMLNIYTRIKEEKKC